MDWGCCGGRHLSAGAPPVPRHTCTCRDLVAEYASAELSQRRAVAYAYHLQAGQPALSAAMPLQRAALNSATACAGPGGAACAAKAGREAAQAVEPVALVGGTPAAGRGRRPVLLWRLARRQQLALLHSARRPPRALVHHRLCEGAQAPSGTFLLTWLSMVQSMTSTFLEAVRMQGVQQDM